MENFKNIIITYFVLILTGFLFVGCTEVSKDPETFGSGVYPEDRYSLDENIVYYISNIPTKDQRKKIEGADPDTFEVMEDGYSKDKNSVYWIDKPIENSDPNTFIILGNGFEKDKDRVFFRDIVLEDADPNTFEIINHETSHRYCYYYGKDKNAVWTSSYILFGENPLLERDPSTFELIDSECVFSKDKNGVYLLDEKLESIDPEKFKYLDYGYVHYEDTIYHSHDPRETYAMPGPNYKLFKVEEADVSTFESLIDLYARDKNNLYYGGLVIDEEELKKEHEEFARNYDLN